VFGSPGSSLGKRLVRAWFALDAAIDTALYTSRERARDRWQRFCLFMDRFHVASGRWFAVEVACETLTLGLAGMVLALMLAMPAFREVGEDWVKRQELAVTFLDRYGEEMGKRGIRHDNSVRIEEFPDHLVKAVLATEDRRFHEHWGIDPIGTLRAVTVNARASGTVQGGSSITQQLAKNLFLSNERSIERKIKEAWLAIWLEFRLSKNDILKLYLDRAYMGGGAIGITAAADFYFGKHVKDVTLAEAAMLAGLFKAPTKFAPHVNLPAARGRANQVLSNMVEAGFLTEGQVLAARRNPATPVDRKREASPDYYMDWAFDTLRRMADAGKLGRERVITVRTPFDPQIQRRAEFALEQTLRQHGESYEVTQGAIVVMDPDGAVRAMVGGRDYGESQFNRATDALRQPGSSWKPFVYATAISAGLYNRKSIVVDSPVCIGNWCPNNYGRSYAGSLPLPVALAKSINTIPVKMSMELAPRNEKGERIYRLGRQRIIDTARKMGITTDLKDTPSLPIGAVDVNVIDMTAGYAVFANGGYRAEPYAAIEITTGAGDLVWLRERDGGKPERVLTPGTVAEMNYMLSLVPTQGTGGRAKLDNVVSAGKTGTTNAYRDAWYVGYTGNYVTGVWFGNDDNAETSNMTGGSLPAMTWKEVMAFAHEGIELKPIPLLDPDPAAKPVAASPAKPKQPEALPELALPRRPVTLSRKSIAVLEGLETLFRTATPPMAAAGPRRAGDVAEVPAQRPRNGRPDGT
jgi:penicillin-binding protein 1A